MTPVTAFDAFLPSLAFIDGVGGPEMLLILVIVLLLFGGDKLPEFARGMGKTMRELKKAASGVEEEFRRAMDEDERKKALARIKGARVYLIPASPSTRGHGTTGAAKFWKDELAKHLAATPRRALSDLQLPADPLVLVLDGIEKPGNLGAILRSADGAGVSAVIVCGGLAAIAAPEFQVLPGTPAELVGTAPTRRVAA